MLYIQSNNEEKIHYTQDNCIIKHKDRVRTQHLLHKALTEITLVQPIISSLSCTLVHTECIRHLIVTFLKYFFLNFPLSYLYNIFAIYFSDNSLISSLVLL